MSIDFLNDSQRKLIANKTCCNFCQTPLNDIPISHMKHLKEGVFKIQLVGICNCDDVINKKTSSLFVCSGPCKSSRIAKPGRIYDNKSHLDCRREYNMRSSVALECGICEDKDDDPIGSPCRVNDGDKGENTANRSVGQEDEMPDCSSSLVYDDDDDDCELEGLPDLVRTRYGKKLSNGCYEWSDDEEDDEEEGINPIDFFWNVSPSQWSKESAEFYRREHQKTGDGRRNIVCVALNDNKNVSQLEVDELSKDELDYHLHLAKLHDAASKNVSLGIVQAIDFFNGHQERRNNAVMDRMQSDMETSFLEAFQENHLLSDGQIETIRAAAMKKFDLKRAEYSSVRNGSKYSLLPDQNEVRTKYLGEGSDSIINNIPIPDISLEEHCDVDSNAFTPIETKYKKKRKHRTVHEPDAFSTKPEEGKKKRTYAYMSLEQIVNHLLASGVDAQFYRIGYPSDFYSDVEKEQYPCIFIKELHERAKLWLADGVSPETRIVLLRFWSDGFENKKIAINPAFNSVVSYTATLLPSVRRGLEAQTLPLAMTYKKQNTKDILLKVLRDCKKLDQPTLRYWGGTVKQVIPTIVVMRDFMQDYIERCSSQSLTQIGTQHLRWSVAANWDANKSPACTKCDATRCKIILEEKFNMRIEPCPNCTDWQSNIISPQTHPLTIVDVEEGKTDYPPTQLTYELLRHTLHDFQTHLRGRKDKGPTQGKLKEWLKSFAFLGKNGEEFARQVKQSWAEKGELFDITECKLYPRILVEFENLNVSLDQFPHAPMHLLFLGIVRSLIEELPRVFDKRGNEHERKAWRDLVTHLNQSADIVCKLSLDWCNPMKFSGNNESQVGTANWISRNCMSFVRLSLYFFGYIDVLLERRGLDEKTKLTARLYKKMILSFVVLVSYLFDEDYVPSCEIDVKVTHYVKLFLSSCVQFDKGAPEKKDKKGNKKDDKQDKEVNKMDDKPFFIRKSNYLSLLGFPAMIQKFGPIASMWEGNLEGYIRFMKREMGVMMHSDRFLEHIMKKVARARFFDILTESSQFEKKTYTRLNNVKIYKKKDDAIYQISRGLPFSGIVDSDNKLWVCTNGKKGTIIRHPLVFNDAEGRSCLNMWYTELKVDESIGNAITDQNRNALLVLCKDYFVAVSYQFEDKVLYAIICRSWKMRQPDGFLSLPKPLPEILLLSSLKACS